MVGRYFMHPKKKGRMQYATTIIEGGYLMDEEKINNEEIEKTENNVGSDASICPPDTESNQMKAELEETTDRLKRLMAEFENFKKRSAKEREGLYNSLLADIVSSFLPVVDNLEKAVGSETTDESYKQGVELVLKQFMDVLAALGVKEIETTTFNPEYHDAVSMVHDDTKESQEIVEVYRKGYQVGDRVIRHAMVIVAS